LNPAVNKLKMISWLFKKGSESGWQAATGAVLQPVHIKAASVLLCSF